MTTMILDHLAVEEFHQAKRKAFWRGWISRLARKCNELLSLDKISQKLATKGQHSLGLQDVPLEKIVGSEGHYRDFDRAFFPRQSRTRARWVSIDKAHREQVPLPPVELIKIGDMYFVRDGNHRVSVARAHRQVYIDAYVVEIDVQT
jgi:hypothetical protein